MKCKLISIAAAVVLLSTQSLGTDLMHAFHDSVENDPVIRAAGATLLADLQKLPQARAALLPQINLNGNVARTKLVNEIANPIAAPSGVSYATSHNFEATITQALINFQAPTSIGIASNEIRAARVNYAAEKQDLILRVAKAYFDVLGAKDNVRFTGSELRANERQLDQAQQRFKVGLDAITTVYQAQASYDRVRAEMIAAKNSVKNNKEELRKITGKRYTSLKTLPDSVPLKPPYPNNVERWVDLASVRNKALVVSRFIAKASRKNIRLQAAANAPALNLQGVYNDTGRKTPGFARTDLRTSAIQFQLAFPVFQGGLTIAKTRQAQQQYHQSLANIDDAYNTAVVATRTSYNNIISGIGKIEADKQAIVSAQSALESTEAAFKVGTNTFVDVLEAQRNLYDSQRILASDTYAYMNDILNLKNAAGVLKIKDLQELNDWLYRKVTSATSGNKMDAQTLRKQLDQKDKQKKSNPKNEKKTSTSVTSQKNASSMVAKK